VIIYKTINLINGKIYVGQHLTSADDGYLGSGLLLNKAIKKYGKENFKREILEYVTSANVNEREIFWIAKLNTMNRKIGYNITEGGFGSSILKDWWKNLSEEDRIKHIDKMKKPKSIKPTEKNKLIKKEKSLFFWNSDKGKIELEKRKYKYSGEGNPNCKYFYKIYKNNFLILETFNLRIFCEENNFPLTYVKYCIRNNGKYKNYLIKREQRR
jgi:group I intron endonuclease